MTVRLMAKDQRHIKEQRRGGEERQHNGKAGSLEVLVSHS